MCRRRYCCPGSRTTGKLVLGTDIGGLGTLIASMASLISYGFFVRRYPWLQGYYLKIFTLANLASWWSWPDGGVRETLSPVTGGRSMGGGRNPGCVSVPGQTSAALASIGRRPLTVDRPAAPAAALSH